MSNLNDLAFPLIEDCPSGPSISVGLTKHELATILIAGHMAQHYTNPEHIARLSFDIAKAVLGKFRK